MTRPVIPEYTKSRKLAGVAIALGTAVATPFMAGFFTTIIFPTVVCTLLYGFAGMLPAAAAMILQILVFGLIGGIPGALIAAAAIALPSAFMIRSLRWRVPFFRMLTNAVGAQILGIVAALAAARIFVGPDIIGSTVSIFRTSLETFLEPGYLDVILDMVFDIDAVPDQLTADQLANGVLDVSRRVGYLDDFAVQFSATLRLTLPGMLLSSGVLTGILACTLPAKLIDRRIPVEGAYVKLARWYTPWWISVGLTATWAVTWILEALGMNNGDVLYLTLQSLLLMSYRIQAAISLERRLTQFNMQPVLRILIIVFAQLAVPAAVVMYYGAFSALFGSTGATLQIRKLRAQRRGDSDDNNDNDINNRQEDE